MISWSVVTYEEARCFEEGFDKLAKHHNKVSQYFKGEYPALSFDERMEEIKKEIAKGTEYRFEALKETGTGNVVGFQILSFKNGIGKIEYLFIEENFRGQGLGEKLAKSAISWFRESKAERIALIVIYGNEAAQFYERLGFRPRYTEMEIVG